RLHLLVVVVDGYELRVGEVLAGGEALGREDGPEGGCVGLDGREARLGSLELAPSGDWVDVGIAVIEAPPDGLQDVQFEGGQGLRGPRRGFGLLCARRSQQEEHEGDRTAAQAP